MARKRRRIRCPYCLGVNTKRHDSFPLKQAAFRGRKKRKKRWYCNDCNRAFTPYKTQSRHPLSLRYKAAELYFDSGASYRGVARQLNLHRNTAFELVYGLSRNCKTPQDVSRELKPQWSGHLIVDGDSILVGKNKESLLLGVDSYSQDIPHAILAEHEDGMNWTHFFLVIKDPVGYPLKGITSDGDPAIQQAREAVFPDVPWQLCVKHFEDGLNRFLRYQFTQKRGYWRETDRFLEAVHHMLYTKSFREAQRHLLAITIDPGFKQAGLSKVIDDIREKFPNLVTHHFHPGMPRTTNIGEGLISRLDEKINRADGYMCHDTCWATLKMLIMWYRFKKFTDCRKKNRHKNGKSPLELAKVDTSNINWIKFSHR